MGSTSPASEKVQAGDATCLIPRTSTGRRGKSAVLQARTCNTLESGCVSPDLADFDLANLDLDLGLGDYRGLHGAREETRTRGRLRRGRVFAYPAPSPRSMEQTPVATRYDCTQVDLEEDWEVAYDGSSFEMRTNRLILTSMPAGGGTTGTTTSGPMPPASTTRAG